MTREDSQGVQIDIASAEAECEGSLDPRSEGGLDPRSVVEGDPLRREESLRNLPLGGSDEAVRGGCTSKPESGVSVMLLVPL